MVVLMEVIQQIEYMVMEDLLIVMVLLLVEKVVMVQIQINLLKMVETQVEVMVDHVKHKEEVKDMMVMQ